jgi:hypothetical protein
MPDGRRIVALGWLPGDTAPHLYMLDDEKIHRVSDLDLGGRRNLYVSPDGRWAAAVKTGYRVAIISLESGKEHPLPSALTDTFPRGWSGEGHLWVSEGGDRAPARVRLLRVDLATGRVLEEQSLGPGDPGGASAIIHAVISRDGRHRAFVYDRSVGVLHIVKGLWKTKE